jgi:hypothetical protein
MADTTLAAGSEHGKEAELDQGVEGQAEPSLVMFPSAWAKIRRARRHLDELETVESAFMSDAHVELVLSDTGEGVLVAAKVSESVPAELPLIVGDCVHNLRSALDHVVFEAVGRAGDVRCEFPTTGVGGEPISAAEWRKRVRKSVPGERAAPLRAQLQSLEPYRGGSEEFVWTLHRLDIIDKHRLLVAVLLATESVSSVTRGQLIAASGSTPPPFYPSVTLELSWLPEDRVLRDGAVITELSYAQAELTESITLNSVLALHEVGLDIGSTLTATVGELANKVEALVARLAKGVAQEASTSRPSKPGR